MLLRSAFLLALIVMLLPSDPREQARLYQTASHALHQVATFCDRNRELCAKMEGHWAVFKDKAAIGARMAMDLFHERMAGEPPRQASPAAHPVTTSDTLQPLDRAPEWRSALRRQL